MRLDLRCQISKNVSDVSSPNKLFPPEGFTPPRCYGQQGPVGVGALGLWSCYCTPQRLRHCGPKINFERNLPGSTRARTQNRPGGGGQQKRSLSPTPARGGGRACVGVASTVLSRTSGGQLANNQSMVFDVALPNMGVMARLFSTGQPDGETLAADAWTSSGSQTRSGRRTGQGVHPSAQPHPALGTPLLSQNGDRNSLRK